MKLFKINKDVLEEVNGVPFLLEKDIQVLIEKNVNSIFGLTFIQSELSVDKYRIDTLCYDEENNSFVIIEYKKGSSYSVIDQGFTYLQLLLNSKHFFIHTLSQYLGKVVDLADVDWSQSRIVFISPSFTSFQRDSVNFKDLPFELWEIKMFSNQSVVLSQLLANSKVSIGSLNTNSTNSTITQVSREVKVYTEEAHLDYTSVELNEKYSELRSRITDLGPDVEVVPRKEYVGFKRQSNFVDIEFQKKQLKIFINLKKGELDDPQNVSRDVSNVGHYGNGDYEVRYTSDTDLDYLMLLIKQSYRKRGV
jgi:predicted transport protein